MQNEKTLLDLGFRHYPEWDCNETGTREYRLDYKGLIFRAHVWNEKQGYPNEKQFVALGIIVRNDRLVDRWRDCCSEGSIKRKIDYEYKRANKLGRIKPNVDRRPHEYTQKQSS